MNLPHLKNHVAVAGCALAAVVAGCGSDDATSSGVPIPRGSEPVKLDPAEFTTDVDNPYWPMRAGSRWIYRETDGRGKSQRVEVTVTSRTKQITGIRARVIHDVASERGRLVEDTYDWVAQDSEGNVWYLGEDTKEYENGKVSSTKGSWQAGVDGAQAGVIVPAKPRVGMTYRQEYYAGEAEDAARVLSLDERVEVPFGSYGHALATKDSTPLEPRLVEYKFYAPGVGPVLALTISGGRDRQELLTFVR
jgi:hypothetical protein